MFKVCWWSHPINAFPPIPRHPAHLLKKICNLPCKEHQRLLSSPSIIWIRGSCTEREKNVFFFSLPITLQFKSYPSCSSRALKSHSQGRFLTEAELSAERPPCCGSHLNQLHALFAPLKINAWSSLCSERSVSVHGNCLSEKGLIPFPVNNLN